MEGASVQYEEDDRTETTVTDDKGYFEFSAGTLGVVTVTASGYGTAYQRWPGGSSGQLEIHLTTPTVLEGTVADAGNGRPVDAEVHVIVMNVGVRGSRNLISMSALTESGGGFRIEDLLPGTGVVVAVADGFAPYWTTTTLTAGDTYKARIRLLLEAGALGTVVDASGSPVAGAFVYVTYSDDDGGGGLLEGYTTGRLVTDNEGVFEVFGLLPDTDARLHAELDDGQVSSTVTVNIDPGFTQENIVLRMQ